MKAINVLTFLLAAIFSCNAQQEEIFRSEKYHFRLVYPPLWAHKTIKDPNIVTKGDKDGAYINVYVSSLNGTLKNAHDFSKNDVQAFLQEQRPVPELITYEKQYIDSVPAMMIMTRAVTKTLDLSFNVKSMLYVFIKDDKMFVINGSAEEKDFQSRLPVLRSVISTFKFEGTSHDDDSLEKARFDSKGSFFISPPHGWIVTPEDSTGLLGIGVIREGFSPNITIRKGKFPATAAELEKMARNEESPTPRKRIEASTLATKAGHQIGRVLTEKLHQSKGYDMRYVFYAVPGKHGENFLLTFTCPVSVADEYQKLADSCILSFIEK